MDAVIEKPVVFKNEGMQIVGMLHVPENTGSVPAVIFYHGCTGTKTEAHWLYVKLARALAAKGIMVLRFDFRHSGDSEGEFVRMTVSGEIADGIKAVEFAVDECGADPDHIGLVGLSLGAVVVSEVAGRLGNRIHSCALLNPVAKPFEDIAHIASSNQLEVKQFPVEFNAYLFGSDFAEELPGLTPLKTIQQATCPVLVVNSTNDKTVQPVRSREYIEAIQSVGGKAELCLVEGADHTFTGLQWERQVADTLVAWFRKTLF